MRAPYSPLAQAFASLLDQQRRNDSVKDLIVDTFSDLVRLVPFFSPVSGRIRELYDIVRFQDRYPLTNSSDLLFRLQQVIRALSKKLHVVILFADVDQFDSATLSVLSHLVRNSDLHCSYVLSVDPASIPTPADTGRYYKELFVELRVRLRFETIPFERFTPSQTADYIQAFLGHPDVERQKINLFHEKTDGNPQLLRETLRHLEEEGQIAVIRGRRVILDTYVEATLPTTIRELIHLRLERLTNELRDVLDVASVIGVEFHHAPISDHLRLEDFVVLRRLGALVNVHRLVTHIDSNHRFSLAAVRDAVYENLGDALAQEHHLVLARYFESRRTSADDDEIIAHHYERARKWHSAVKFHISAANSARETFSPEVAAARFRRAHDLQLRADPRNHAVREELQFEEAASWYDAARFDVAADLFRGLIHETDDPVRRQRSILRLGLAQYLLDQPQMALNTLEPLVGVAGDLLVDAEKQRLLLILSNILFHVNRWNEGRIRYVQALQRLRPSDPPQFHVDALRRINMYYVPELALPNLKNAQRMIGDRDQPIFWELHHNIGTCHMLGGEMAEAERHFREALKFFEDAGSYRTSIALNNFGLVQLARGELSQARETFRRARGLSVATFERLSCDVHIAIVDALSGDADRAAAELERLWHVAAETSEVVLHEIVLHNLGWVYGLAGKYEESVNVFRVRVPQRKDLWYPFREAVRERLIAKAEGRPDEQSLPRSTGQPANWWFKQLDYEVNDIWFWE